MPSKTKDYKYNVEIIKAGQPRPYADSEYQYVITSDCGEYNLKQEDKPPYLTKRVPRTGGTVKQNHHPNG